MIIIIRTTIHLHGAITISGLALAPTPLLTVLKRAKEEKKTEHQFIDKKKVENTHVCLTISISAKHQQLNIENNFKSTSLSHDPD